MRSKLLLCYLLAAVVTLSTCAVAMLFVHPMLVIGPLFVSLGSVVLIAYLDFPKQSSRENQKLINRNVSNDTRSN